MWKVLYKVLVQCICNQLQIHPTTSAQNFVQNSVSVCLSVCLSVSLSLSLSLSHTHTHARTRAQCFLPPKLSGHKITHISGMYFFWHGTQTLFFCEPCLLNTTMECWIMLDISHKGTDCAEINNLQFLVSFVYILTKDILFAILVID